MFEILCAFAEYFVKCGKKLSINTAYSNYAIDVEMNRNIKKYRWTLMIDGDFCIGIDSTYRQWIKNLFTLQSKYKHAVPAKIGNFYGFEQIATW